MRYISTRGDCDPVTFSQAVAIGLAPDGGLYLPERLPDLSSRMPSWEDLSYEELTIAIFNEFVDDIEPSRLRSLVSGAYSEFNSKIIAPVVELERNLYLVELFHGPTLAFKDFALQLLGRLYEDQIHNTGKHLNALGATSGDTGAAAIHGLQAKSGIKIFILYPNGRISPLQERQMTCTGSENVFPLAIEGSFDDAQKALKETFEDHEFKNRFSLSSVNSINLARLLAQCVYYFYAWFQLPKEERDAVNFVVPTGNFGNVLAGWMAQRMGLPIAALKISTNQNDILHRFFQSGIYELGEVERSNAPSMDIQVASNFERFIYYHEGKNGEKVKEFIKKFRESGRFVFRNFDADIFSSSSASNSEIEEIIKEVYSKFGYILDPHTACGFKGLVKSRTNLILATAHPAKFPETIIDAIGVHPRNENLEGLWGSHQTKYLVRAEKKAIQDFIAKHAD
ncbi:MAG: Threonine synthase [Candidatus Moanabacter tarae]|uniref:Threonine synthase n=1 Tax=Candidatus Moanibacter tarae TaxID=2200854 RepID=A0A2Z4AC39_9BACT|nr:MAG: Threonine synthase [Candidatus Moanabacter tarae]|tara:strand:- start:1819 stop:3177 length:1359 start_codon:yes stop_codon:yes gene_type:complete